MLGGSALPPHSSTPQSSAPLLRGESWSRSKGSRRLSCRTSQGVYNNACHRAPHPRPAQGRPEEDGSSLPGVLLPLQGPADRSPGLEAVRVGGADGRGVSAQPLVALGAQGTFRRTCVCRSRCGHTSARGTVFGLQLSPSGTGVSVPLCVPASPPPCMRAGLAGPVCACPCLPHWAPPSHCSQLLSVQGWGWGRARCDLPDPPTLGSLCSGTQEVCLDSMFVKL